MTGMQAVFKANAVWLLLVVVVWIGFVLFAGALTEPVPQYLSFAFAVLVGAVAALMAPGSRGHRLVWSVIGGLVGAALMAVAAVVMAVVGLYPIPASETLFSYIMETPFWFVISSPIAAVAGLIGGIVVVLAQGGQSAASR